VLILFQPERSDYVQKQNQGVFIRGFRISIRDGIFAAVFGRRLDISSVSESTPADIFGSQSGSSPFSQRTRSWSDNWFGGENKSQTSPSASNRQAPASFNSEQRGEIQACVQDVVLDPILTTSEVVLSVRSCCVSINLVFIFSCIIPSKLSKDICWILFVAKILF
jgi:hypothetical protein